MKDNKNPEKELEEFQKLLDRLWDEDLKPAFNHPFPNRPQAGNLEGVGQGTALFNFQTNTPIISKPFIDRLAPYLERRPEPERIEASTRAITGHEIGHYAFFPRELSDWLYFLAYAESNWGGEGIEMAKIYGELPNEMGIIQKNVLGDDSILELREGMVKMCAYEGHPDSAAMQRLLLGVYQKAFKLSGWVEPEGKEAEYFEEFSQIDYLTQNIDRHCGNLATFVRLMDKYFPKRPKPPQTGDPFGDLKKIDEKEIDRALREIITQHGKRAYERAKKFVERHADFKDPYEPSKPADSKGQMAGLGKGKFDLHDEEIPFYIRWASTFPCFIHHKEAIVDSESTYKGGLEEYEIGDPIQDTDVHASRGMIGYPGISKIRVKEKGIQAAKGLVVPGLNVGKDTSGSMDPPTVKDPATLASFILGRNYERNKALVGGWNFSEDIAWVPLSRELMDFYSLMCGYWGGGTYMNTEKVKKIAQEMMKGGSGIKFEEGMDERELQRVFHQLPEELQRECTEKKISPDARKLKGRYEMVDNVLITDGYIWNLPDVVAHLNTLAEYTRNFIFVNNKSQYEAWSEMELPNTWVYRAEKPEDFVKLALGRAKAFREEVSQSYRSGSATAFMKGNV